MVLNGEASNILKLLIENKEEKFSIRKIALLRKINYKSAYLAIKKLEEERIVGLERYGNTLNCFFTGKFNERVFAVESFRIEELIKNPNFDVIYSKIKQIYFPAIVLLFGSSIKGKIKKNSDIDFLVITEKQKEIEQMISLIPLKIHLTIIKYEEFVSMLKSKEFSVVSEAIKKNIILLGIEDYYRLIENAR